jgi:hypothetical protein
MPPRRSNSKVAVNRARLSSSGHVDDNGTLNRTTIFLPDVLNQNLGCIALEKGESKATIVRLALAQYMISQGYDPYKKPKITVSHR